MMCSKVDLPAPDGPMIDTNSPSLMSSMMRRKTHVRLVPCAYDFSMLRNEMRASAPRPSASAGTVWGLRENNAMYDSYDDSTRHATHGPQSKRHVLPQA